MQGGHEEPNVYFFSNSEKMYMSGNKTKRDKKVSVHEKTLGRSRMQIWLTCYNKYIIVGGWIIERNKISPR